VVYSVTHSDELPPKHGLQSVDLTNLMIRVLAYGMYERQYQINASVCTPTIIRQRMMLSSPKAAYSVTPIAARNTSVAMMRFGAHINFICLVGPTKKKVLE
jgi:hypothetical protein